MADEAIIRDRISNAIDFTWAVPGTGALKGTILKLSGARMVAPCSADNDPVIGILGRDKIAGDGRNQVPVYIDGIFDCQVYAGGAAITVGQELSVSGANRLKTYTTLDDEKGYILGRALEPLAAGNDYIQVLVGA
jgi:hypothetical protein